MCQQITDPQERQVAELEAVIEIENLMCRHSYLSALKQYDAELDELWMLSAPDVSYGQNQGFYVGGGNIRAYYAAARTTLERAKAEAMKKLFPEIADRTDEENYGVGSLNLRTLTTPVIEIAGDGATAKGMWYSIGHVVDINKENGPYDGWVMDRYAVDFVLSDSGWKILHFLACTDFCVLTTNQWAERSLQPPLGSLGGAEFSGFDEEMPGLTVAASPYSVYHKTLIPQTEPPVPEPYYTFAETFSYGAPAV